MNLKRPFALFMALAMLLSAGAFADDAPDTAPGGSASGRSTGSSARAVDELGTRAALYMAYSDGSYTMTQNITGDYEVELREGLPVPDAGEQYGLGGIRIQCGSEAWDGETSLGNSGIVINQIADETTPVVFGGDAGYYKAPDNELYNSVILLDVSEDETPAEDTGETASGVGLAFNGSEIELKNVYIETSGAGRPAICIPSPVGGGDVTQSGGLVCVDSAVVSHDTHAMLLMGGDVWILNSDILTDAWGALSCDSTDSAVYAVNSRIRNTDADGYAVCDDAGCAAYIYGSEIMGGNAAVVVCRNAELTADTLDNTSDEAAVPYDGSDTLLKPSATDGETRMIAYNNPILMYADMSGPDSQAKAYLRGAYISTMEQDVVFDDNTAYADRVQEQAGVSALITGHSSGACVLLRSHSGKLLFEDCELHSRTGVLVHSLYAYDASASGIYPQDGAEYTGDEVIFRDMEAEGDILHEDYMRKMELTLENTVLTGRVVSATLEAWNEYWTELISDIPPEELTDDSGEEVAPEELLGELIHDDSYDTVWGVRMTMDEYSSWCVTDRSSLYSFIMEDGASVTAPEGLNLAIYVDCPMSNDRSSYDITGGTRISEFEPDVEYTGVVIVVEDPQTAGLSLDEATLAALGITTEENDGGYNVSLSGLLDMLGGDVTFDEATGTVTVTDESGLLGLIMGNQTE